MRNIVAKFSTAQHINLESPAVWDFALFAPSDDRGVFNAKGFGHSGDPAKVKNDLFNIVHPSIVGARTLNVKHTNADKVRSA